MESQILSAATMGLGELLSSSAVDEGHNLEHALSVLQHARAALDHEQGVESDRRLAILLAALLHDADDAKFFSTVDYANARRILVEAGAQHLVDAVIAMIELVSCSKNGNSTASHLDLIPRYCDRLEAIGAVGILRCYLYTTLVGREIINDSTPLPRTKQELAEIAPPERLLRYVENKGRAQADQNTMIGHFYDKLLHIADVANPNPYLRAEFQRRHAVLVDFLLDFDRAEPLLSVQRSLNARSAH